MEKKKPHFWATHLIDKTIDYPVVYVGISWIKKNWGLYAKVLNVSKEDKASLELEKYGFRYHYGWNFSTSITHKALTKKINKLSKIANDNGWLLIKLTTFSDPPVDPYKDCPY